MGRVYLQMHLHPYTHMCACTDTLARTYTNTGANTCATACTRRLTFPCKYTNTIHAHAHVHAHAMTAHQHGHRPTPMQTYVVLGMSVALCCVFVVLLVPSRFLKRSFRKLLNREPRL